MLNKLLAATLLALGALPAHAASLSCGLPSAVLPQGLVSGSRIDADMTSFTKRPTWCVRLAR